MTQMKKGFTLIELLVVIAIIGILSAVVLTSLNSARSKANDAKVKAQLNNVRAAAELYYDNNSGSYTGVFATSSVSQLLSVANMPSGATVATSTNGAAYAIRVILPSNTARAWCIDSAGASKEIAATGVITGNVCP